MDIAFIDHRDSFSFNVINWLRNGGFSVQRIDCEDHKALMRLISEPKPLVLSPGPKSPADIPATLEATSSLLGKVPILGVCLGYQVLGTLFGGRVVKTKNPHHGSLASFTLPDHCPLYLGMDSPLEAAVYNSLVIEWDAVKSKSDFQFVTRSDTGETFGFYTEYQSFPVAGIQFHPESFLSVGCERIAWNWRRLCGG